MLPKVFTSPGVDFCQQRAMAGVQLDGILALVHFKATKAIIITNAAKETATGLLFYYLKKSTIKLNPAKHHAILFFSYQVINEME
ncbi:hypothetical protein [Secundilactobacillus collinoides]|uniref:Uncharacterized protein n=2 Tax=Secundilactobacillus collinoides TaxID=33960 RepID=A0A0R2B1H2_SECCO|nr:hypothetical protein [Secundilactobacillus collinoides]KRM73405.1 hypothetical protein FC82_GL001401 [Secundilactobacillus collinoides DSM 20515 = JCM 1123]KZL41796.1 hypothetical protein TY91_05225 [Secundilactobacillus collinoides]